MSLWVIEDELRATGYAAICGVDEAGRGPLAGSVFAAAVILPFGVNIPHLDDSKKVSEKRRDELFDIVKDLAVSYSIAFADVDEIEKLNILGATFLAMNRAIGGLGSPADIALIDGNQVFGIKYSCQAVPGGDGKSASIAAASILAKVSRDRYMLELAERFPQYDFHKHKGYGTKLHYEKLREFGPSEIHRPSFLKKLK
ncbi:MAG: ribonuclease HII [Oscillospiraceae bacterium]|nr:ribonuclease HII [Oscillospiraceae bacterium]MCL2278093.1 ribonuclease HII [Oscillospiraceae bacterium]